MLKYSQAWNFKHFQATQLRRCSWTGRRLGRGRGRHTTASSVTAAAATSTTTTWRTAATERPWPATAGAGAAEHLGTAWVSGIREAIERKTMCKLSIWVWLYMYIQRAILISFQPTWVWIVSKYLHFRRVGGHRPAEREWQRPGRVQLGDQERGGGGDC